MSEPRDVVVIGAGAGGSLLALLLGRQGLRVTLADGHGRPRSKGAEILKPRAIGVLAEAGVLPRLLAAGARRGEVIDFYHDGEPLQSYRFGEHTALGHFLVLPHHELVAALLTECDTAASVDIRFDAKVVAIEPHATAAGVRGVRLADGSEIQARWFVDAASGSSPLTEFVGPAHRATDVGHRLWATTVPLPADLVAGNRLHFASTGWFSYLYDIDGLRARVFVGLPSAAEHRFLRDSSADLAAILRAFVSESPATLERVSGGRFEPAPFSCSLSRPYHRGNVILLGDSAYNAHPMTGQDIGFHMEDAVTLAGLLSDLSNPRLGALLDERYEVRRPEHERLVAYGNALARSFHDREAYLRAFDPVLHGGDRAPGEPRRSGGP